MERPDPAMSNDLIENIHNIQDWYHYDNWQHGRYVNENNEAYGPIKVFNARVHLYNRGFWHGDVSERRLKFLEEFSRKFSDFPIYIYWEHQDAGIAYKIGNDEGWVKKWDEFTVPEIITPKKNPPKLIIKSDMEIRDYSHICGDSDCDGGNDCYNRCTKGKEGAIASCLKCYCYHCTCGKSECNKRREGVT